MINAVDGGLRHIFEIRYYLLELLPPDFLGAVASVFEYKYNLLEGYGPVYLGILYGRLIYELSVSVIIFDLEQKGLQMDSLVAEGVQRIKYLFELPPALGSQHALLLHVDVVVVLVAGDAGAIVQKQVQEFLQSEFVLEGMGGLPQGIEQLEGLDVVVEVEELALVQELNEVGKADAL